MSIGCQVDHAVIMTFILPAIINECETWKVTKAMEAELRTAEENGEIDDRNDMRDRKIAKLKQLWPQLKLVHGKPRYPQSQGSMERVIADIKDILVAWMNGNNSQDWAIGFKFVQQQKNCAHHAGINRSPHKAMFEGDPKVGLTSSSLPPEILERLKSQDNLLAVLQPPSSTKTESTSDETDVQIPSKREEIDEQHSVSGEQPPAPVSESRSLSLTNHPPAVSENSATVDKRLEDISNQHKTARESQLSQAERMVKHSRIDLKGGEVGDNVAVPILTVDRGRDDPRNIIGVIVDRDENHLYRIAVEAEILSTKYSRNQFDLCPQRLLNETNVNTDYTIALRQALRSTPSGG
ncbi:uncharacterized protein LOC143030097 [Oratosquilla oratoria]|uniref:uncharacterized protein LOC143030097 n=1 Tax=Oratosquilla oratoria TaxID=337810 RepID=UPI003F75B226